MFKRILPELALNQSFVDMFLHEARLSVALSHANIVQVFDLGREEDTYFIAMEYVLGSDLAQSLRRCRRDGRVVPVEVAVLIACEVARALDYAHRRRIKLWGRARVVTDDRALVDRLMPADYPARPEQAILFTVAAWDVNCPQHIPRKLDATDVAVTIAKFETHIAVLEAENSALRAQIERMLP